MKEPVADEQLTLAGRRQHRLDDLEVLRPRQATGRLDGESYFSVHTG